MRNTAKILAMVGMMALATPAMAQIVNGTNGPDNSPPAPIGTKAGDSSASAQAPGETAAAIGAHRNNRDFRKGQADNSPDADMRASDEAAMDAGH